MALRRRRIGLALVLALLAALAHVGPSAAFDSLSFSRSASASVVADAAAYDGLAIVVCTVSRLNSTNSWCTFGNVVNQAGIDQTFRITEEVDADKRINQWRIGGGTAASTGYASTPSTIAVGSQARLDANAVPCFLCPAGTQYTVYWTIDGEKPNKLNSLATRVQMTLRYT